jgi:membrane-associated phospholipid phosphatase
MTRGRSLGRFAAVELGIWASLYPAYLLVRGSSIEQGPDAVAHAVELVDIERATGLFHEADIQSAVGPAVELLSVYYMLGFGPLIAGVLIWLGLRHRELYRDLRTLLLTSLGLAVIGYLAFPTAPPRLVPGLGITDTVGMSAHDTGSVAGIRFNPYAAMPSMHVGWSILIGFFGFRAARRLWVKSLFVIHPFLMVVTVTATGNHYFIDAIGGAGAVLLAAAVVAGLRRALGPRSDGSNVGGELIPLHRIALPDRVRRAA